MYLGKLKKTPSKIIIFETELVSVIVTMVNIIKIKVFLYKDCEILVSFRRSVKLWLLGLPSEVDVYDD